MTLEIDVSTAPRRPLELRTLVNAVYQATPEDEADWIEWKSNFDLKARAVRATLARHIIAMANRRVEEAARFAEGFGLILVGVEPGNRCGIARVDLADLDAGIGPYLGPRGPRWTAGYVTADDSSVLVITVDPPHPGDLIHTMHRDFEKYRAGDIYVRRSTRTERAGPGEIDYLTQRAAQRRSRLELQVSISPSVPALPPLVGLDEFLDTWVADQRQRLLACLHEPALGPPHPNDDLIFTNSYGLKKLDKLRARVNRGDRLTDLEMAALKVANRIGGGPPMRVRAERRTPDRYQRQVENYLSYWRYRLLYVAYQAYLDRVGAAFTFEVRNPTNSNLSEVLGEVVFPHEYIFIAPYRSILTPPNGGEPSRPFGPLVECKKWSATKKWDSIGDSHWNEAPRGDGYFHRSQPFVEGNMRPLATQRTNCHLIVGGPVGTEIPARWEITATNVDGRIAGEFAVRLEGQPIDFADLIASRMSDLPEHMCGQWSLWPDA